MVELEDGSDDGGSLFLSVGDSLLLGLLGVNHLDVESGHSVGLRLEEGGKDEEGRLVRRQRERAQKRKKLFTSLRCHSRIFILAHSSLLSSKERGCAKKGERREISRVFLDASKPKFRTHDAVLLHLGQLLPEHLGRFHLSMRILDSGGEGDLSKTKGRSA